MKFGYMARLFTIGAALALPASAIAQENASNCLTKQEIASGITSILPAMLETASLTCRPMLPENAALSNLSGEQLDTFKRAAHVARPNAANAIRMLVGDEIPVGASDDAIFKLVDAMLPIMLAGELDQKACGYANKFWPALAPLPPENWGQLVALFFEIGKEEDKGKESDEEQPFDIDICPDAQN